MTTQESITKENDQKALPDPRSTTKVVLDEAKIEAKDQGKRLVSKVGKTARAKADEAVSGVSSKFRGAESAINDAVRKLEGEQPDYVVEGARTIQEKVGDAAQYFETHTSEEITEDVRGYIKNNPVTAMAGLAIAGFCIGRFLKASGGSNNRLQQ
ncbi:MAG: hypothetical protein P1U89_05125 [Verrucomicrobiales bacterium]|nr:hypothetical protein [Verrucomicrobiales bacterium]